MVATQASRHFYTQEQVDDEVRSAAVEAGVEGTDGDPEGGDVGVQIWTDEDEWSVGLRAHRQIGYVQSSKLNWIGLDQAR